MKLSLSTFFVDRINAYVCCSKNDFEKLGVKVLSTAVIYGVGLTEDEAIEDYYHNLNYQPGNNDNHSH